MKALLDQNISYRLVELIKPVFTDVYHVKDLGLIDKDDYTIFMAAHTARFDTVLTLDADFHYLWQQHGVPSKVIWLRVGNCSTAFLAETLLRNHHRITEFLAEPATDCLEIFL
jgi:predicted nuclease of predicted toxin-antitoxin system